MDLFHLVRKLNASEGGKPRFFQCCGHKDGLLEQNRRMRDVFEQEISLQYQYKESPGNTQLVLLEPFTGGCIGIFWIFSQDGYL